MNQHDLNLEIIFKAGSFIYTDGVMVPDASLSLFDMLPEWVDNFTSIPWQNDFDSKTSEHLVQDVYQHLMLTEDLLAIWDGRYVSEIETAIADIYKDKPKKWQTLFKAAWETENPYVSGPEYFRPSLWLLSSLWMEQNGYLFTSKSQKSLTFRENEVPTWDIINQRWSLDCMIAHV